MKLTIIIVSYLGAFMFGIYAQSIAYFLENYLPFEPFPILVVCTVLCFTLYIFSISYYTFNRQKLPNFKFHEPAIVLLIVFALPVLFFSFIVCMFWWG